MKTQVWISEDDEETFVVREDDKWHGRAVVVDVELVARYVHLKREWSALQDELAEIYTRS